MNDAYEVIGTLEKGGLFIIADHASNHVPNTINLGITTALQNSHIAWDIGVDAVTRYIARQTQCAAILAVNSRLVIDLNRNEDDVSVIPNESDGEIIPGNFITSEQRIDRLRRYFYPYHEKIASCLREARPALILSLHSFTPQLTSKPDALRPWDIGILYNQDERAARIAIPFLDRYALYVGDQLPYSGKQLNATMNRHAETNGIAYLGVEIRQDVISNATGQARYATILAETCHNIIEKLGAAA
jgi:predicted N-formylglutamate amidohydrolase